MEHVGDNMEKQMARGGFLDRYDELVEEVLQNADVRRFLHEHRDYLTPADIRKSYAKLYEFVQEKRKFELRDPSMIAPGYEPKLVLNFHYVDVTYVPTQDLLQKQKEAEIQGRMRAVDMPKDIREARLERFDLTDNRSEALQKALSFVENYCANPRIFHKGLYLQGSFGVGKTYLLGAIAYELAENGVETTLVHFPTFATEMKQAIGKDMVGEKLNKIKKAPILMMDDIGADTMSSWIRDEVFGVILQYRMQEELPMFFSSNLSMAQLETEYLSVNQKGDTEPLKAKRLMERINFLTEEVTLVGQNRRT